MDTEPPDPQATCEWNSRNTPGLGAVSWGLLGAVNDQPYFACRPDALCELHSH